MPCNDDDDDDEIKKMQMGRHLRFRGGQVVFTGVWMFGNLTINSFNPRHEQTTSSAHIFSEKLV
jgi:hypothetical protein